MLGESRAFGPLSGIGEIRCPFRPVYREMQINGNGYKVLKVAGWMRAHTGRTLEDYDRYHVARREDSTNSWRNFKRSSRQEAITRRCYSLVCACPPSPLRVVYNISSDDEPCSLACSVDGHECAGEDVILL